MKKISCEREFMQSSIYERAYFIESVETGLILQCTSTVYSFSDYAKQIHEAYIYRIALNSQELQRYRISHRFLQKDCQRLIKNLQLLSHLINNSSCITSISLSKPNYQLKDRFPVIVKINGNNISNRFSSEETENMMQILYDEFTGKSNPNTSKTLASAFDNFRSKLHTKELDHILQPNTFDKEKEDIAATEQFRKNEA